MTPVFGAAVAFAGVQSARADVVAQYPFTGGATASIDTAAHSAAGAFALGSGANPSQWGFSGATNTAYARSDYTPGSEASAVAGNDYFTFTLTPDAGYTLSLSSLSIDLGGSTDGSFTITSNYAIRSSVDGFTSDVLNQTQSSSSSGVSLSNFSATLGSGYNVITAPVEFRIYVWDNQSLNPGIDRIRNVTVNGTAIASVPMPAAFPAGLALMGGLFAFRRRG